MEKDLIQYGAIGIMLALCVVYINKLRSDHKKERKDLLDMNEKNFNRVNEITDENNRVLRENTNILSGLKTLLENKNR